MSHVGSRKDFITRDEVEAKRASLHIGDTIALRIGQYDMAGAYIGTKKEKCRVEQISTHVVVFRRPNGLMESRLLVELSHMEREAIAC